MTASTSRPPIRSTSRRSGAGSVGGPHRYTGISRTSAPAARRAAQKSGCGSPCSWTATRWPATPRADQVVQHLVASCSVGGDHGPRPGRPRAAAARACGPRATRWAAARRPRSASAEAPALGRLQPAAQPDRRWSRRRCPAACRRRPRWRRAGRCRRASGTMRRAGATHDPGAARSSRRGELVAAPVGGDGDGEPGERRVPGAALTGTARQAWNEADGADFAADDSNVSGLLRAAHRRRWSSPPGFDPDGPGRVSLSAVV